ncbi:MAG: HAD family hydrolase [Eubacterium sp.]|nr:HAD family hydrolase [Eubacterium sp.]
MNTKLIFLDIDGTLTLPGENVPPKSAIEALNAAKAAGHKLFLCTGRNPAMLAPLMKYGFDGVVAVAGGYVAVGDKVLYDCPMTPEQFETAMRLMKENDVFRTIEARDGSWCDEDLTTFFAGVKEGGSELMRWRKAIEQDLGIMPMSQFDGRPIYKIVYMCHNLAQLEPAREALESDFRFVTQTAFTSDCINGEMINRNFDKGHGVRLITDFFGEDLSDTYGFGDSMNDLEMIETVGTACCMENGSPELKAKCDFICAPPEKDGLALAFRDLRLI